MAPNRNNPARHHVDMLSGSYGPKDGIDRNNRNAVLAINNQPDDVDALHDARKVVKPLLT